MNEVLKNVDTLIKIVAMSRSQCVEEWNEDSFAKALKWGQYFEQVYQKVKTKGHILQKLQEKIDSCGKEYALFLGTSALQVTDLESARSHLMQNLMQNTHVPVAIFKKVCKEFGNSEGTFSENVFLNNFKHLLTEKRVVWPLLENMSSCNSQQQKIDDGENEPSNKPEWSDSPLRLRCLAGARLLRRYIEEQMSRVESDNNFQREIRGKLQSLSSSSGGQMVILSTLILDSALLNRSITTRPSRDEESKLISFIMTFVKDVLVASWQQDHKLFTELSPTLMGQVSVVSKDFLKLYVDCLFVLFHRAVEMEDEENTYLLIRLNEGTTSNASVLLESITVHLKTLKESKGISVHDLASNCESVRGSVSGACGGNKTSVFTQWEQLTRRLQIHTLHIAY